MQKEMLTLAHKAEILVEALPYIQKFAGKRIVIKYGGNAMLNEELTHKVLQDIALLKYIGLNPIVVHGGGPEINKTLKALGIKSQFSGGLRVTDAPTMEVVQMVLAGKMNKDLVSLINQKGARAVGISGMDANCIQARQYTVDEGDLGYVGEIEEIHEELILDIIEKGYIPVVASVGCDAAGHAYNINADTAAASIRIFMYGKTEKQRFLQSTEILWALFPPEISPWEEERNSW